MPLPQVGSVLDPLPSRKLGAVLSQLAGQDNVAELSQQFVRRGEPLCQQGRRPLSGLVRFRVGSLILKENRALAADPTDLALLHTDGQEPVLHGPDAEARPAELPAGLLQVDGLKGWKLFLHV